MAMIGKSLAHYSVTAEIGKGGMGVVYQAKDQKLGRDVAIKVLPEEFAKDTDRVARFQREAKLLASLNHPNIAAIHGLEEADGTNFLVMELIEGQTLADRIKGGPVPVEESLKLGLQIAEALEAAHEKGVIHRDLKPANIKVTPDGKVKVLDFGLAKAYAGDSENMNLSNSPTLSDAATQQGVILGTAAYMSPEQAKGKSVDKRADIWAFGIVVFEMLSGRQLFVGETVSETLAAVLMKDVDFAALPPNLHPRVKEMLERCLQKDPRERYSGIGDARFDLARTLADPSGGVVDGADAGVDATAKSWMKSKQMLAWASVTVILLIVVGIAVWLIKPSEPHHVMRFNYEIPAGQKPIIGDPFIAISQDGSQFVYCTNEGIYLRSLNEFDAKLIPGTDELPMRPVFSPDGQSIAYVSRLNGELKIIPIAGGAPQLLSEKSSVGYLSWNSDNTIIYGFENRIFQISANGGSANSIVEIEEGFIGHPQLLPDGESVIFTVALANNYKTMVHSFKSGETHDVIIKGSSARYIKTGHIVYGRENSLYAIPFDKKTLKVTGQERRLVNDVVSNGSIYHYAVSDTGALVYASLKTGKDSSRNYELVWVDREGNEDIPAIKPHDFDDFKISPDGTKVALAIFDDSNWDIWIWDTERDFLERLTSNEADDEYPLWSSDGKRIIFASNRDGTFGVYSKGVVGSSTVERLDSSKENLFPSSLSLKGDILALVSFRSSSADIAALSMKKGGELNFLLQEEYLETQPKISPDGRWLAYTTDYSGFNSQEVYVRPFPEVYKWRRLVSSGGGTSPLWSPDSRELFYHNGNEVMAVPIETDPTFNPGKPSVVFEKGYVALKNTPINLSTWDIHPNGKRFLMQRPAVKFNNESINGEQRRINIVVNWFEDLKKLAPVD